MPGPGSYNGKNYIQDEPSFAVHKFQQTARPLNKVNMKDQTELIEYMQERRNIDRHASINEYRGYESSIGMNTTRVSDIGRRLFYAASTDEAELPFAQKPGYTWGVGTRT